MTKKQIIERLTKIENFLLLSDDEIAKESKVDAIGVNSYNHNGQNRLLLHYLATLQG